ncbi:hypothetical protein ACJJTC_005439 [Scirpophaga incertulas]
MFGREIRTPLHVMFRMQAPPTNRKDVPNVPSLTKVFYVGDRVQARNYATPHRKWEFGTIVRRLGRIHYEIRTDSGNLLLDITLMERGDIFDKIRAINIRLRSTPSLTGMTPYGLMFGREIRTPLHVMFRMQAPPTNRKDVPNVPSLTKVFYVGDRVQARNYATPHRKWEFGTIVRRLGRIHYEIRTDSGNVWQRHAD